MKNAGEKRVDEQQLQELSERLSKVEKMIAESEKKSDGITFWQLILLALIATFFIAGIC